MADLERLPILLDKEAERELQERSRAEEGHPFGEHLCAPIEDVVAVASTSGTTGAPTFYAFTAADVATTDELWARALRLVGVRPGDTVLHGFGLSMFLAGLPGRARGGADGRAIVPIGAEAGSERLLRMAELVRPRVLLCTPSYATYLAEQAAHVLGRPPSELGIEIIGCAGEPGAGLPEVRAHIQEAFGRPAPRHARRRPRRDVRELREHPNTPACTCWARTRPSSPSSSTRRPRRRSPPSTAPSASA